MLEKEYKSIFRLLHEIRKNESDLKRRQFDVEHDIDVPQVPRGSHHLDQLHTLYDQIKQKGFSNTQELTRAKDIIDRIKKIADNNKADVDHQHLDTIFSDISAMKADDDKSNAEINNQDIVSLYSKLKAQVPHDMSKPDDHHKARSKAAARFMRTRDVAEGKKRMSIKDLPEGLLNSVKNFLSEKKELTPKQAEKMDTDKDGDIDAKDLKTLRDKKKNKSPIVTSDEESLGEAKKYTAAELSKMKPAERKRIKAEAMKKAEEKALKKVAKAAQKKLEPAKKEVKKEVESKDDPSSINRTKRIRMAVRKIVDEHGTRHQASAGEHIGNNYKAIHAAANKASKSPTDFNAEFVKAAHASYKNSMKKPKFSISAVRNK